MSELDTAAPAPKRKPPVRRRPTNEEHAEQLADAGAALTREKGKTDALLALYQRTGSRLVLVAWCLPVATALGVLIGWAL